MSGAAEARRLLLELAALPRPAGGPAEERARRYCAASLAAKGFDVREEPFSYSTLPGRFATPAVGILSIIALGVAGHHGAHGRPTVALTVLGVSALLLLAGAAWMTRRGVLSLPWGRARGINLVAMRGEPTTWLVAHLDSKSQPIPILVRALGILVTLGVWGAAVALAVAQLTGVATAALWPPLTLVGWIAGLPIAASLVGARSPGALDDASGVACVLLTASLLAEDQPVAILLTSAEELGLGGARAWAASATPAIAINFDGIDDSGELRFTYTGRKPRLLVDALRRGVEAVGERASVGRLVPGVLLDGVALADQGWHVITVSRGTLGTVARIHTSSDSVERMTGEGIARTAAVAAHAVAAIG